MTYAALEDMDRLYPGVTMKEFECRVGHELGVVRISLGLASNFQDVFRVLRFAGALRVDELFDADELFEAALVDEDARDPDALDEPHRASFLLMTEVTTFLAPSVTNSATSGAFSRT